MSDPEVNAKSSLLNENAEKNDKKVAQKKKDPILVQHVILNEDFYALTWNACRKEAWEKEETELTEDFKIQLTPADDRNLILCFLTFIVVILVTVGVLLFESFASDAYTDANWPIVILRITLVSFAQQKLKPEVFQGLSLLRYSLRHYDDKFIHPFFATFVAFCQTTIAVITFWAIFFFCCMADEALELIMNFAGLAVISELDDWVGEQIMAEQLYVNYTGEAYKDCKFDFKDLNERMGLFTKLCIIGVDLEIIDNQNHAMSDNFIFRFFSAVSEYIPYNLIPLLTIPMQTILAQAQEHGKKVHEK